MFPGEKNAEPEELDPLPDLGAGAVRDGGDAQAPQLLQEEGEKLAAAGIDPGHLRKIDAYPRLRGGRVAQGGETRCEERVQVGGPLHHAVTFQGDVYVINKTFFCHDL